MSKETVYFYLSKMKLVIAFIVFLFALNIVLQFTYLSLQRQSYLWTIVGLGFVVLFFKLIWSEIIKKWLQNKPYLIMTDTYLVIHPDTKIESVVYYDRIKSIRIINKLIKQHFAIVFEDSTIVLTNSPQGERKNQYILKQIIISPHVVKFKETKQLINVLTEMKRNVGKQ